MPEDWVDESDPQERVETIVETMHRPSTAEEIAEWAHVEIEFARGRVSELVDDGMLERHDDRYMLSTNWALAYEIRQLGMETEEGVLIPYEVLDDMESGPSEE